LAARGEFTREELIALSRNASKYATGAYGPARCGTHFTARIEDWLRFAADLLQAARSAQTVEP